MNITKKIIITDTNIITDLSDANVLLEFIMLDNVYICDMIKVNEINEQTGNIEIINKMKVISATSEDINRIIEIQKDNPKLSVYDCINFVISKKYNALLATGDKRLREYALKEGVEVIRTIYIIKMLYEKEVIMKKQLIAAFENLLKSKKCRIPKEDIEKELEIYKIEI